MLPTYFYVLEFRILLSDVLKPIIALFVQNVKFFRQINIKYNKKEIML